jgi:hypothetical protein
MITTWFKSRSGLHMALGIVALLLGMYLFYSWSIKYNDKQEAKATAAQERTRTVLAVDSTVKVLLRPIIDTQAVIAKRQLQSATFLGIQAQQIHLQNAKLRYSLDSMRRLLPNRPKW